MPAIAYRVVGVECKENFYEQTNLVPELCCGVVCACRIDPSHAVKKPKCKCCHEYAVYLRECRFEVEVKITDELSEISRKAGVPEGFEGCHTLFVDGYVVEGSVPVRAI